jgi:hypothetical protein
VISPLNLTSTLISSGLNRRVQLQLSPRHQAYQATRHENSPLRLMCFSLTYDFVVYIVFFVETVQTALSGADLYYWFAAGFGNIEQLTTPYASPFDVPIMGSLVSLSVQFFFVYRIWVLSEKRSWWLCVVICLVTSPSKSQNNLTIIPVALHCRHVRSVRGWGLCESPFHISQNIS